MPIAFQESETRINLMRAFAGESQARNRYTFAASQAKQQQLHVLETIFKLTADQELAHAKVFYDFLQNEENQTVNIEAGYPVDLKGDMLDVLRAAQHNEMEEHNDAYPSFAQVAEQEGFPRIATAWKMIAEIEKTHADRFGNFANLLEKAQLFADDQQVSWMCLNCGYIHTGKEAPSVCPVCTHNQGYFVRLDMAPYTK